jgi:multimeric flavodoxin WrbA
MALILAKIKACDILVIATPIWFGVLSSVAKMVIERLDGTYMEGVPETVQYPLYGKATGVIVTENKNGAHDVCSTLLFNLTHLGAPFLQMQTITGLVMRDRVQVT